jgi:hypothetical protein
MGTYNIYVRVEGKKRFKPIGSFDWFTHDEPFNSAKAYVSKKRVENPQNEYQVKDANGVLVKI